MNIIFILLFLFALAQLIGLYTASVIINDVTTNPYVQAFVITENTNDQANALYFFIYILIGTAFLIFLIRLSFAEILIKLLEIVLISTSSSIVFYSFFRIYFNYETSMAGGILLGILFAIAKFFFPSIKNIATILATAGVGVVFGISLGVVPVIILLLLLSIYDYIAVFKTRHMVEMANFMMKKELSFTVTARTYIPALKKEARIDLGSGDIIAPIMFEVSALHLSPLASLLVFVGAVSSLSLFLFLAYRKRMVLPALPPITFGMILLFLVGHIAGAY